MAAKGVDGAAPAADELRLYAEGRLEPARFDTVDRWVAAQDPATQERILGGADAAGALAVAAGVVPDHETGPFNPDLGAGSRFALDCAIGAGGMGIVELVRDRVLGREVVVKRCRPRRPDESPAAYARRQQLFKREAQLTAQLEHPGIVPVHDVGDGPLGEPAFTMKRLEGEPLSAIIARRRAGEPIDMPRLVEVILRVADAVGYAHSRGIVHRDLKPDNIIAGALGAVYVIDWGLAGSAGTIPRREAGTSPSTASGPSPGSSAGSSAGSGSFTGSGMGTPAWMAPEQFGQVKADPRMDVFAIGGLLMACLTGRGPRDRGVPPGSPAVNLSPLDARLPRGLAAVARRCLEMEPAERYADAPAVADDLRRWLAAGLTSAENPGPLTRLMASMRRSRRLSAVLLGTVAAAMVLIAARVWWSQDQRAAARREIEAIAATTPSSDLPRLREAHARASAIGERFPGVAGAEIEVSNLRRLIDERERSLRQRELADRVSGLMRAVKVRGTWPGEADEFAAALRDCGLSLSPAAIAADAAVVAASPLRTDLLAVLAYLLRAQVVADEASPLMGSIPVLMRQAAPDDAWRGVARLLAEPALDGHDLALPDRPDALAAAAASPRAADLVLSLFGTDHDGDDGDAAATALRSVVQSRLREDRGSFWARIAAGRAALAREDFREVAHHALVALGKEPQSLWPHLLLAYCQVEEKDWANVLSHVIEIYDENPHHLEVIVLRAVGMCGLGSRAEAQELIASSGAGPLLRWHFHRHSGHALERSIGTLLALGLEIPAGDPEPGGMVVPRRK